MEKPALNQVAIRRVPTINDQPPPFIDAYTIDKITTPFTVLISMRRYNIGSNKFS
jgi:hypothetical protein